MHQHFGGIALAPGTVIRRAWPKLGLLAGLAAFGALACEPVSPGPETLTNGVFCLDFDVSVDESAFVLGNDSVLDCQGHRIKDSSGYTQNAVVGNGDNIVLRNCVIDGFTTPVYFYGVNSYRIEDSSFHDARATAIMAIGADGLVSGNTVSYPTRMGGESKGIVIYGIADIIGNTITKENSVPGALGEHVGIVSYNSHGGVVAGNIIRDFVGPNPGRRSAAIVVTDDSVVYRNVLVAAPGLGDLGVACSMYSVALKNVVVGFPSPYEGCPEGGYGGW